MKTEEIKTVLRTLIRNEVKKVLKEEARQVVIEEVNRAMGKVLVEMVKEIKVSNKPAKVVTENTDTETEELQEVIHTKNPKLNKVLAETARFSKPLPRTNNLSAGLADLMAGGFDKVGQDQDIDLEDTPKPAPKNNMEFLKQIVSESTVPQTQSVLDAPTVPKALQSIFKKDFRATMRKMDEIKKNGSPGLININQTG